ncbi:hypothetical protein A1S_3807 [Acinetobacter baumannii ATCC 17978]|nr:hypothetical protein A1S_3807 [Acinetobacter baumannii ATCC 17978]
MAIHGVILFQHELIKQVLLLLIQKLKLKLNKTLSNELCFE